MSEALPVVYLARHGETAWTLSGQHTGRAELPLTERGERNAALSASGCGDWPLSRSSPVPCSARSAPALASFGVAAEIDPDLVEWDCGQYEGRRTAEIHAERPDWGPIPRRLPRRRSTGPDRQPRRSGRGPDARDQRRRAGSSHGHLLRVLAARCLGLDAAGGRYFLLSTASLSALGYEYNLAEPAIRLWNETRRVET
jgi:broad specificity phosphatase PhoE